MLNPYAKIKTIPTTNRIRPRAATGSNFFNVFIKLNASNRGYMDKTTTMREIFLERYSSVIVAMKGVRSADAKLADDYAPQAARRAHVPLAKNAMSMTRGIRVGSTLVTSSQLKCSDVS